VAGGGGAADAAAGPAEEARCPAAELEQVSSNPSPPNRAFGAAFRAFAPLSSTYAPVTASGPPFTTSGVRLPCSALSHAKASAERRLFFVGSKCKLSNNLQTENKSPRLFCHLYLIIVMSSAGRRHYRALVLPLDQSTP
jgi:hypothetical protein